jgi:hypothetical protein
MNVNITGIYDNTVIVDSNLFEDVRLLQTGLSSLSDKIQGLPNTYAGLTALSSLSDNVFSLVEGLPNTYASLTGFSSFSNKLYEYQINIKTNFSISNLDIENTQNIYITNTSWSILSTAIDDQFELTTTYIDEKATEQHENTDHEIEALRNEGYIQEAVTQILAWAISDAGKWLWKEASDKRPYT